MNSSAAKGLKVNPFTTVRDPQTGQWYVCKPEDGLDGRSDAPDAADALTALKSGQSSQPDGRG